VVGRGSAPFPDDVAARVLAARVDPPEEASGQIRPLRVP
jgi:acyl-CoA thioester hydrolase